MNSEPGACSGPGGKLIVTDMDRIEALLLSLETFLGAVVHMNKRISISNDFRNSETKSPNVSKGSYGWIVWHQSFAAGVEPQSPIPFPADRRWATV